MGCPLINCRFSIAPSLLIVGLQNNRTLDARLPSQGRISWRHLADQHAGDTPDDTRTRCGVAIFGRQ